MISTESFHVFMLALSSGIVKVHFRGDIDTPACFSIEDDPKGVLFPQYNVT